MSRTAPEPDHGATCSAAWQIPSEARCSEQRRGCQGRGQWQLDPYAREIAEQNLYRYLCDSCAQELADI